MNPDTRLDTFEGSLQAAAGLLANDPSAALERATELAATTPDPRAFRLAAAANRALGREEEAVKAEVSAIRFGLVPPLKQAVSEQQSGNAGASRMLAEQFLRAQPRDLLARTIAAEACVNLRQYVDGEALLREVIDRAPAFPRASVLMAKCFAAQLRIREAVEVLEKLLTWAPGEPSAIYYLADLHAQLGDYPRACELYEELVDAGPADSDIFVKFAHNLRVSGRRAESVRALRRTFESSPSSGAARWALAYYFPDELTDQDAEEILKALRNEALTSADRSLLQVAMSIIHDRRGEREEAFKLLATVKQSRARELDYSADLMSAEVDRAIAEFTPELFRFRAGTGEPDPSPIFVVGMPRSGSTLTERILGRHSKIEAAGELQVMPHLVAALEEHRRFAGRPGAPAPLPEDLTRMARWYLDRAREFRRTDKPRFIDKYNTNWLYAGLIRLMLPNARIIDIRRDALDCCWSTYRTLGDAYTNDQRHLARYYRDYVRFVDAIDRASPGGILTIRYEELVEDVEGQTRRMLDFLDLEFEPSCVDFHLSTDAVATPSSEQVRRPINREGIGVAQAYRQWLGPMIDELGELAV